MPLFHETMKFKNPTDHTVKLDAIGLDPIGPGEIADVPLHLAAPGRHDNGGRAKSAIECVAPQLVPATQSDHDAWMQVPALPEPVSKIVSIQQGPAQKDPPGVKALREAQAKKAAEAAQTTVKK